MKLWHRIISILLAFAMILPHPITAYAATTVTFDISKGSVNITASSYSGYNSHGTRLRGNSYGKVFTITGTTTTNTVTVAGTQNITLSNCIINVSATGGSYTDPGDAAFCIVEGNNGNVNVTLVGENTLQSGSYRAGLEKSGDASAGTLTISGTGSLTASTRAGSAGIGGGEYGDGSNITISGGTVTTTGYYGAGIGGGYKGSGSNITINGGTVIAISSHGAGIGGGFDGSGGTDITINGVTITARSSQGAGIGGGPGGIGSNITISDSTVTTTGGSSGAGIGGGDSDGGSCSNITIINSRVIATGGSWGAGIGGGDSDSGLNITISGSTVTAKGGKEGAGIGGGSEAACSGVTITGGSVKAVAGRDASVIGGGWRGGGAVTPTNGTNNVYCLPVPNPNSTGVTIDGVSYTPVNHKAVDSSDTNLYAYVTSGTHVVTASSTTQTYTHVLDMSAWYTSPTASTIEYGQQLSSSLIQSTVISEAGSTVSGTWAWESPTTKPSSVGTHTYNVIFTEG